MSRYKGGYIGGSSLVYIWPTPKKKKRKASDIRSDYHILEQLRVNKTSVGGTIVAAMYNRNGKFSGFTVHLLKTGVAKCNKAFCPASMFYKTLNPQQFVGDVQPFLITQVTRSKNYINIIISGRDRLSLP